MPDLDLQPGEVREIDPRTGRDKRDNSPRWYRNWMIVCLIVLALIFWKHTEIESGWLFAITALFGIGAGGFFHGWLRDVY